jgi:hypothetical protein
VAAVIDSSYVMVSARNDMVEAGMLLVVYGCSARAMSNLCKDVLELPSTNKPLVFCTIVAKGFGNRHFPRTHLRPKCLLQPDSKPPMLQLPSPTRCTGADRLFVTVSTNRNAIDEVFIKALRKNINMDRPAELAAAVDDPELWDAVDLWTQILSEISAVPDYLQSDTTPLSGFHLSFVYMSYIVLSTTLDEETKTAIAGFLKSLFTTLYDDIHVLSFYLDPLSVPARDASRMFKVKAGEESRSDASQCLAAAAALTRAESVAEQQEVQAAVITVCIGGATYFFTATSTQFSARVQLPHAW